MHLYAKNVHNNMNVGRYSDCRWVDLREYSGVLTSRWTAGGQHLLVGTGTTNKQSDGTAARKNKTRMTICCYGEWNKIY